MRSFILSWLGLAAFVACSSSPSDSGDAGNDAAAQDVTVMDVSQTDASGPQSVTFSYTPQWGTVTAVSVLGAFNQTTDWTAPFLALTNDGTGTFKGTTMLPPGNYLYVFKVIGDDAATNGTKYSRFAIDPQDTAFLPCPMASPTFDANNPNPCSSLTVPQVAAPPLEHVTGVIVSDGAPIADYLVEIERDESTSHHFFVNRVTTKSDGKFDLVAAAGQYRLQILTPTFLNENDDQRNPTALAALRRDISSSFPIATSAVVIPNAEMAFHDYAAFNPVSGMSTLPTSFAFGADAPAHVDVYGTAMDGGAAVIGDPWFTSPLSGAKTATFDGGFNTQQANQTSVALGERYFWGIEENIATDAGVTWTAQSMVFDITWH